MTTTPGSFPDNPSRMVSFMKRKKHLLKKAMELSVLCDCNIAMIVFSKDGSLVQYSSNEAMDKLLERYAEACQKPHERFTNENLFKEHYAENRGSTFDDLSTAALIKKRMQEIEGAEVVPSPQALQSTAGTGQVGIIGPSGQAIHIEGIKPAGFMDDKNYPVSPKSEKAYKEITSQFEQWIEHLSNGGSRTDTHQEAGPGPGSETGGPGSGSKRFKALSVMVPESQAQPILQHASEAAAVAATENAGGLLGISERGAWEQNGLLGLNSAPGGPRHSLSDGMMGLSLPSPGNLLFGLPSDGLFTSRGSLSLGLGLDLPTPDSERHLSHLGDRGGMDWPSGSPGNSVLPGFSDDGESGEEIQGDLMMVTGRSIQSMQRHEESWSHEGASGNQSEPMGEGRLDGLLVVSGVKLGGSNGQGKSTLGGSEVDFPGFAPAAEGSAATKGSNETVPGVINDIPLDI
ncbi:hypothetical protein CEUSTIGMA_g408.t1 [Chlamydomonas eustigma]|uniref:MADS-box domain-containing protein n=1 Tax=Chlamydomonas eustigma TaxID=1157962 RepID=A0A250WQ61_9CHLO|nr:hypothetical protein CEUSTIGMA_g408.t1 [Chlamydomonas eustigma]|eukprot:GAX72953.1 hypothetical protein CEUSTIGMA_g408.t1 [Chlamydomonas eustigma]